MSGDARFQHHQDASCNKGFVPARQATEGNSSHSERNIRGTCTIVYHNQKLAYLGFQYLDHPPYSLDLALLDYTYSLG